jgi:hypothetical protein
MFDRADVFFRWVAPKSGDVVYDVFHARSGVTESIFGSRDRGNTAGGSVTGTGHPRYLVTTRDIGSRVLTPPAMSHWQC